VALTVDGKFGFDSGEGAWELATTSKEGSRRVITQSQFDEVVTRNIHIGSYSDSIMGMSMIQKH